MKLFSVFCGATGSQNFMIAVLKEHLLISQHVYNTIISLSSMLMTLSSSFLSLHATSHKTFNSYKTPFLKSRSGWLPTSFLSTPLKLNFYSLVFLRSSLKLIILLYLCLQALPSNLLLLLEIWVLFSIKSLLF